MNDTPIGSRVGYALKSLKASSWSKSLPCFFFRRRRDCTELDKLTEQSSFSMASALVSWFFSNTTPAVTQAKDLDASTYASSSLICSQIIQEAEFASVQHPGSLETPIIALSNLILQSGNSWPPKATHAESWPSSLKPYHTAFLRIAPLMPVKEQDISLDDAENRKRIERMRESARRVLEEEVCIPDVCETLEMLKGEDGREMMTMSGWLGFYSCLASLRHAYRYNIFLEPLPTLTEYCFRWAILPVVREAQTEQTLQFPRELDIAWPYIQRRLGITSPGGSMSSNSYCNIDSRREIVYRITEGLSEDHRRTELWNSLLFVEVEDKVCVVSYTPSNASIDHVQALPVYLRIAKAAQSLEIEDIPSTISELRKANDELKAAFKHFYQNMNDFNLVPALWLPYCQGFQGWTLDGINGVSGGQNILIRTMDSFLGIRPFPEEEEEKKHLPLSQREWLYSLRRLDIRKVAMEKGNAEVAQELEKMVSQLRVTYFLF